MFDFQILDGERNFFEKNLIVENEEFCFISRYI